MTVIYGHVIHGLRRATAKHQQQANVTEQVTQLSQRLTESEQRLTEQFTEQLQRTVNRLSVQFTEQFERTVSEQANISETLAGLAALPAVVKQLQQEVAVMEQAAQTEQQPHRMSPNMTRPKLSVVETNSEHRTANSVPKERTHRTANSTESDKGAFVRSCLAETPNMRNADIQRKASEQGLTISPAYISEVRKAFVREQSA